MSNQEQDKATEADGDKSGIPCNVIHYEADLFNAAMMTTVAPNPISGATSIACIAIGGMSKRLGIAKDLFPFAYGRVKEMTDASLAEAMKLYDTDKKLRIAVEMAFEAAEELIEEDKRRPPCPNQ